MSTPEQRMQALEHANQVRAAQARLRAQLHDAGRKGGSRLAARIVLRADTHLRFLQLLLMIPGVGDETARRMLGHSRINPAARVNSELVDQARRRLLIGELLHRAEARR